MKPTKQELEAKIFYHYSEAKKLENELNFVKYPITFEEFKQCDISDLIFLFKREHLDLLTASSNGYYYKIINEIEIEAKDRTIEPSLPITHKFDYICFKWNDHKIEWEYENPDIYLGIPLKFSQP